jgi:hypothetical protein
MYGAQASRLHYGRGRPVRFELIPLYLQTLDHIDQTLARDS